MNLLPHQQRVVDEKIELGDKLEKLGKFIGTQLFKSLPEDERDRLNAQNWAMLGYFYILQERIKAFPK